MCILLLLGVMSYKHLVMVDSVVQIFCVFAAFFFFLIVSVAERRVFKSPTILVELCISHSVTDHIHIYDCCLPD